MSVILFIDTSDQDSAKVALDVNGKRFEKTSRSRVMRAQMVLPLIELLLKEHGLQLSDISEIRVHEGPGSYTGIRVGMSVANALALLVGIPVHTGNFTFSRLS